VTRCTKKEKYSPGCVRVCAAILCHQRLSTEATDRQRCILPCYDALAMLLLHHVLHWTTSTIQSINQSHTCTWSCPLLA